MLGRGYFLRIRTDFPKANWAVYLPRKAFAIKSRVAMFCIWWMAFFGKSGAGPSVCGLKMKWKFYLSLYLSDMYITMGLVTLAKSLVKQRAEKKNKFINSWLYLEWASGFVFVWIRTIWLMTFRRFVCHILAVWRSNVCTMAPESNNKKTR